MDVQLGFILAAVLIAAVAAFFDWRTGHIPDALSYVPLVLAPIAHVLVAWKLQGLAKNDALMEGGISLLGAVLCSLVPLLLWRQNALGGGDVKMFIALGAVGQPSAGFEILLYTFVLAAVIAPARMAYEGKLGQVLKNSGTLLANAFLPKDRRRTIDAESMTWFRLGPCIFLGTVVTAVVHWTDR